MRKLALGASATGYALATSISAYERIFNELVANRQGLPNFTWESRVQVFGDIWCIIDQTYALSKLLPKFTGHLKTLFADHVLDHNMIKSLESYADKYSVSAAGLRNGMDHIADNLENLSKRRGATDPLHGTLSYAVSEGKTLKRIVCLSINPFSEPQTKFGISNPLGKNITTPIGHLEFYGFGKSLNLSDLYNDAVTIYRVLYDAYQKEFFPRGAVLGLELSATNEKTIPTG